MTELRPFLHLGARRWPALALAIAAGFLTIAAGTGLLATSAYLISRAALRPPVLSLLVAIVLVRAFALGRAAFRYLERVASHEAALRLLADIRGWFYQRIEPLAPAGLVAFRSGDLLARLVADVEGLQDLFVRSLAAPVVALLAGAAAVAGTAALLPAAAPVLGAGLAIAGLALPSLVHRLAGSSGARLAELRGTRSAEQVEVLEGAADLIAFGARADRLDRLGALDRGIRRLERREALLAGLGGGLTLAVTALTSVGVMLVGVAAVRQGSLDGVLLGVVALLPLGVFEAVAPLAGAYQQLGQQRAAASRILAAASAPAPVAEPSGPAPEAVPGTLALERATVRYSPNLPPALDGVDVKLESGRKVALVGPSGAGKTTVAAVLVRFRDLDEGRATLSGRDLRDYRSGDVRRVVGLVTQDVHLFNGTILENVRLARPDATREEVEDVAERARVLDWVRSLPAGWDTPVGERGLEVSGGERQRIALARALLARFPVLILDEPTGQLDPPNANAFMEDLLRSSEGATLLVITHRLHAMERMDEIVVLNEGRVIERGRHEELMAMRGLYRRLWDLQSPSASQPAL